MFRVKGEVLSRKGANELEVESCFQGAIKTARCQQAKSLELRAILSLCRYRQRQEQIDRQALQLLESVYSWFKEGLDTADLKFAADLLKNAS